MKQGYKIMDLNFWFAENSIDELKRDIFYFDKIVTRFSDSGADLELAKTMHKNFSNELRQELQNKINEVQFLVDKGIIVEFDEESYKKVEKKYANIRENIKLELGQKIDAMNNFDTKYKEKNNPRVYIDLYNSGYKEKDFMDFTKNVISFVQLRRLYKEFMARHACLIQNEISEMEIYPILQYLKTIENTVNSKKEDVINITLKKFPIPDSSISWEQIFDFKSDSDSVRKLNRLRSWIVKMNHTKYSAKEIEQELEFLLAEYTHRMDLHNLKYNLGNLELFIMTSVGFIENFVKLNFSKAAKSIFDIKRRKVDLLIGETKAPGKEIAYIEKLNLNFNTITNKK